jgi:5,6-dimethylbenzimidazole synthase
MAPMSDPVPPEFDSAFAADFDRLLAWRRDVRRFKSDALPPGTIEELVDRARLAPSVGNSQPWRFVRVRETLRRAAVRAEFERCNKAALAGYDGDRARNYAALKLAGFDAAPEQLAVFCDMAEHKGHGLGRATMPETLRHSVVCAVHTLWLAARLRGVGVGWVSIVEPDEIARVLDVPLPWSLVAYLCVGYPAREDDVPELERAGWQARDTGETYIVER